MRTRTTRPTAAAIIGGGSGLPRPGAASRAHRGVLFLDEAPEYDRGVLDALRQPLESGELVIHRSAGSAAYPARFQLVLAANPCPCGKATGKGVDCICTPTMRRRYLARMSGPLLDRVDIQLEVERVSLADFGQPAAEEDTASIAARVRAARSRQLDRLLPFGMETNAQVPGRLLRGALRLDAPTTRILDYALERGVLTARGYDRVLRLAWTLADLALRDVAGRGRRRAGAWPPPGRRGLTTSSLPAARIRPPSSRAKGTTMTETNEQPGRPCPGCSSRRTRRRWHWCRRRGRRTP